MAVKEFTLQRLLDDANSTAGEWRDAVTGAVIVAILERGAEMADGHPRIAAGRYRLRLKTEGSKFDERYKNRFQWFRHMVEVDGVPDRNEILIHTGNRYTDSEGCMLTTMSPPGILPTERGYEIQAGASMPGFAMLYPQLYRAIDAGEAWVTVHDINQGGA